MRERETHGPCFELGPTTLCETMASVSRPVAAGKGDALMPASPPASTAAAQGMIVR